MAHVRAYAEPTVDNPDELHLCFDVTVNGDNTIIGAHPAFGKEGIFTPNGTGASFPFVLYPNGVIDYGAGFNNQANERLAHLNASDGPIVVGRLLTLTAGNYQPRHYSITVVLVLGA